MKAREALAAEQKAFEPGRALDTQGRYFNFGAGPFDAAWMKAREALAAEQKEFEPGRAVVTQEDFTATLRRARVR